MEIILIIQKIMELTGNITLGETVEWLKVEENAEKLRNEGHEDEVN